MDGISFEDILNHYLVKLNQISDDTTTVSNEFKNCLMLLNDGWKGESANIFESKVLEMLEELNEATEDIFESKSLISAIREEYLLALGI